MRGAGRPFHPDDFMTANSLAISIQFVSTRSQAKDLGQEPVLFYLSHIAALDEAPPREPIELAEIHDRSLGDIRRDLQCNPDEIPPSPQLPSSRECRLAVRRLRDEHFN